MKKRFAALAICLTAVFASACGSAAHDPEHSDAHQQPNGDLRETTESIGTLPAFLEGQPDVVRNAYIIAGLSADVLEWIPCYCGCGESAGHRSSKNCFIYEVREDGKVVWDDHGTRCGVCIQIAVESAVMHKDGKTLKEIRQAIDAKYGQGYGAPTPTPMPM